MKNTKKLILISLLAFVLAFSTVAFTACQSQPVACTVTFETFGGTTYEAVNTENTSGIIQLPTPEKEGCIFLGWYDNAEFEGNPLRPKYAPKGDVTLYAKWQENIMVVTFNSNGGTEYNSVESLAQAIILPVPEKADHIFAGWYDNAEFEGEKLEGEYLPTASVTLYAKWEAIGVGYVSFETFGGTTHETMRHEGEGIVLPTPVKYGYEFAGWYLTEDCSGEQVGAVYTQLNKVTLYAKWEKVTYLYVYYDDTGDYERISLKPGDQIAVADYAPAPIEIDGYTCTFKGWEYDDYMGMDTQVPEVIVIGDEHIYLVAKFDKSAIPGKERFEVLEDGSVEATGKGIKVLLDEGVQQGAYSLDISLRKGRSGAALAAFRMVHSGNDYAYEDVGTYYLAAGIDGESGSLYMCKVTDGAWARIKTVELGATPEAWQRKWNASLAGEMVSVNIVVYDLGTKFIVYVDGEFGYEGDISSINSTFKGTGLGIRSSSNGSTYANWKFETFKTVHFNSLGGSTVADVSYGLGKLHVQQPTRANMVFTGWYYDENCTQIVDMNAPVITDGITLYAGWRDAKYSVTLIKNGVEHSKVGYEEGAIVLPELADETNRIFNGWYYDEECTQKVDAQNPAISSNVNLYAGYRFPLMYVTDLGNGQYKIDKKTAGVFAINEHPYYEISMPVTFKKNGGGGGGIAFRMKIDSDYSYENCQYLTIDMCPNNGALQIARISNGFAHFPSTPININNLPEAWRNTYNAAADQQVLTCVLMVRDYGSYFEAYIDGELCYTSTYDISGFTGNGIGVRSSTIGLIYSYSIKSLCAPVNFEVNGGEEIESIHYLKGFVQLPVPVKAMNVFNGWYLDEGLTVPVDEATFAPTAETTLYASWVKYDYVVTLNVNGGNALSSDTLYYANGTAFELPVPIRNIKTLASKNIITYTFAGWYFENGDKYDGTITSNVTLTAQWKAVETRNGVVVTRDENGKVTYSDSGKRVGSTGASVEGWDAYEIISDYTENSAYEVGYTLTINSFNPSKAPELRLIFMANPKGYLTSGTNGRLEIDGTGEQTAPFFNFYLTSGRINFGAKITGTSAQPVQGALDIFKGSKWHSYFSSLKAGDAMVVDIRFAHGIKEDGSVWFKFYIFDEILYTYGLSADAGTTNMVDGERVYGKILTSASVKSHAKLQAYLQGKGAEIKGSHGFWTWDSLDPIGGLSVTNLSSEAIPAVTFTNGSTSVVKYLTVGSPISYALSDGARESDDAVTSYKKFIGWKNAKGEMVNTVSQSEVLTAVFEDVALYKVTFNGDNGDITSAYYEAGQKVSFPADPTKNGEVINGSNVGYSFKGWYAGEDAVSEGYVVNGAVEIVAKYDVSIAHVITYVTNCDIVQENSIVADGETFELPVLSRNGYSFHGWYTDEACENKYQLSAVGESFTLYAKWIEHVTVTFVNNGKELTSITVDKGESIATLPTASRATETMTNGNLLTYAFAGWYNGESKLSAPIAVTQSFTATAKYNVTETRNGVKVLRDSNGNVVSYLDDTFRTTNGSTSVEGYDFEELECDWNVSKAYEISYTVNLAKKSTTATELRLMFLTNPRPYITGGCAGHLEVDGTNNETVWVDIYLQNGRVNFGGKLIGTTGQPHGGALSAYTNTNWYALYNATAVGSPLSFDVRIQQGIYANGSAWFKFYLEGDLFFTYGLTADEGTTNVVDGETVHGKLMNYADLSSHLKLGLYLDGGSRPVAGGVGAWTWANLPNTVGSITINNFSKTDIAPAIETNGGSLPEYAFVTNSRIHIANTYKAGSKFAGWYYDSNLTKAVDLNNYDATISNTIYAKWESETYTVTLIKEGKEYAKMGYSGGAINLPVFATAPNRIYTGWYYDEAFTKAVDTANPVITADTTLYAGWRYPVHNKLVNNGDGTYSVTDGSAIGVFGEMSGAVEHTMTVTFKKKGGGGCGVAFRMLVKGDNSYEKTAQYLTADICPNDGSLQVAAINGNFAHITSTNKVIPLASLPTAWQTVYNGTADQGLITLKLTVKDYGSYFEVYLNDDLAYTSTKVITAYVGTGCGIRSSTKNITFTYEAKQIATVKEG